MRRAVVVLFTFVLITKTSAQNHVDSDVKPRKTFFEIPFSFNYANVVVPQLMSETITSGEGGNGIDLGAGLVIKNPDRNFEFRGGIHIWNHPFNTKLRADENDDSDYILENGKLTYTGIYLRFNHARRYFFAGGGVDFSVANSYKGDRTYFENGKEAERENGVSKSLLTDDFKQAFKLVLSIGAKIPLGENSKLKPFLEVGIPLNPIYPKEQFQDIVNTPYMHVYYDEPVDAGVFYFPIVNYGIALEL